MTTQIYISYPDYPVILLIYLMFFRRPLRTPNASRMIRIMLEAAMGKGFFLRILRMRNFNSLITSLFNNLLFLFN